MTYYSIHFREADLDSDLVLESTGVGTLHTIVGELIVVPGCSSICPDCQIYSYFSNAKH